jgi:hypothetical protein
MSLNFESRANVVDSHDKKWDASRSVVWNILFIYYAIFKKISFFSH